MVDAVFKTDIVKAVLTMAHWDEASVAKSAPVLELYKADGSLSAVTYFGADIPTAAYTSASITPAAYSPTVAGTAEAIGGTDLTLSVPLEYFASLPTNGFDFFDASDTTVAGGLKITIADGTKLVISEASAWDNNEVTATAASGETFATALDKLTPSDTDGHTVSAYVASGGDALASITVTPATADPAGAIKTAFAALDTDLKAYYADNAAGGAALYTEVTATDASSPKTLDVLNSFLLNYAADVHDTTIYAFQKFETTPASTTDLLWYEGGWVKVLTSAKGESLTKFLTDNALLDTTNSKVKPGLVEVGTFSDKHLKDVGENGTANLKAALTAKGFLGDSTLNEHELGNYLWEVNNQFDPESYFWVSAYDLSALLEDLAYTGSSSASDFKIDTSVGKNFVLDSDSASTLQLNGLQFTSVDGATIMVENLGSTVAVDLSNQDYAGAELVLVTWDSAGTSLTGVLDAGLDVRLEGNGPLDITGITTDATAWTLTPEAKLVVTATQKASILGDSDTDISVNAILSVATTSGSTTTYEDFRIMDGVGDDTLTARTGAESFLWMAGDGNDKIINFDLTNDKLYLDSASTAIDLDDTNLYTVNGDGNRVYAVGSETVTLERAVTTAVSPFVIDEVADGRWGNYITYEVKLGSAGLTGLEAIDMKVSWDDMEFEYVTGSMKESNLLPEGDGTANESMGVVNTGNADVGVLRVNSALKTATDVTAGQNVFEFMLKRIDPNADINSIKIDFVNYDDSTGTVDVPTNVYDFNFVTDKVTMNLETQGGLKAPNPKVYVADGMVMDGLSVIPTATHGDYTQYEIVYNVSQPAGTVPLTDVLGNSTYNLSVMGKIVSGTAVDYGPFRGNSITDFMGGDVGTVGDASTGWATLGFDRSSLESSSPSAGAYTTTPTTNMLNVTVNAQTLAQPAYTLPGGTEVSAVSGLGEGRYTLGSFIAVNDTDISFINSGDNSSSDAKVTVKLQGESADKLLATAGVERVVDDGSEIYLLGDHWYSNPESYLRAVTASDALEVLKMDVAIDMSGHSNAQIIAADFDRDGTISAMDAYEILKYSAKMPTTAYEASKPMGGKYMPEWFYIDNIDNKTSANTSGTKLDPDAIKFDKAIDKFVGANLSIDATAVLVGDVTGSYTPLYSNEDVLYELGKFQGPTSQTGNAGGGAKYDLDITGFVDVEGADLAPDTAVVVAEISTSSMNDLDNLATNTNVIKVQGTHADATVVKTALGTNLKSSASTFSTLDELILVYSDGSDINVASLKFTDVTNQSTNFGTTEYSVTDVGGTLITGETDLSKITSGSLNFTSDTIGTSGNDTLTADSGGSTIVATTGADTITLGNGEDVVDYDNGPTGASTPSAHDVIKMFDVSSTGDKLDLNYTTKLTEAANVDIKAAFSDAGATNLTASVSSGGVISFASTGTDTTMITGAANIAKAIEAYVAGLTSAPSNGSAFFGAYDDSTSTWVFEVDDTHTTGTFKVETLVLLENVTGKAISDTNGADTIWIA